MTKHPDKWASIPPPMLKPPPPDWSVGDSDDGWNGRRPPVEPGDLVTVAGLIVGSIVVVVIAIVGLCFLAWKLWP